MSPAYSRGSSFEPGLPNTVAMPFAATYRMSTRARCSRLFPTIAIPPRARARLSVRQSITLSIGAQMIVVPPSAVMIEPVIALDRAELRKVQMAAISAGVAARRSGTSEET